MCFPTEWVQRHYCQIAHVSYTFIFPTENIFHVVVTIITVYQYIHSVHQKEVWDVREEKHLWGVTECHAM